MSSPTPVRIAPLEFIAMGRSPIQGLFPRSPSPPISLYLGIGAQLAGTGPTASRWFNGSLDDIRLYKRALSAAEIKTLYNNVIPAGFTCTSLQAQAGSANTGEKPMSKVWSYTGKWWSVFPASSGVPHPGHGCGVWMGRHGHLC